MVIIGLVAAAIGAVGVIVCGVALYRGRKWPTPPKQRAPYWPDGRD